MPEPSASSGISLETFPALLLCCVLSVVMKIDYQYCYKLDTHISIYMQTNGLPANQQQ